MKTALAFLAAIVLTASAASAAEPRRTLHAGVDGARLVLQAPEDFCFYDNTRPAQAKVLRDVSPSVTGGGLLLGLFAPCDQVAAAGTADATPETGLATGAVIWAGARTGDAEAFLDARLRRRVDNDRTTFPPQNGFDGERNAVYDAPRSLERGGVIAGYATDTLVEGWRLKGVGAEAVLPLAGKTLVFKYGTVNKDGARIEDAYKTLGEMIAANSKLNQQGHTP